MNRSDHLGEKVLYVLEVNGRLGVEAIAEVLNEKPKAVSVACINLHRLGKAQPIRTGQMIRNRARRKKPEVFWQIGPADNIPPMPNRPGNKNNHGKQHNVMEVKIGIDDTDLEWMERYRQQRQQRQQRIARS